MYPNTRNATLRAIFHEKFPLAFAAKGAPKTPLAIGIADDLALALPEITAKHLRLALADYCNGPTYLRHCTEGAARIGLDGQPRGMVSASDARYAAARCATIEHWNRATDAAPAMSSALQGVTDDAA